MKCFKMQAKKNKNHLVIQITGVSNKKAPYLLNCRLLNSCPAKLCQNCFQKDLFMQRSIPESKNKTDKNPFVKFRTYETSGGSLEGKLLGSYISKHRWAVYVTTLQCITACNSSITIFICKNYWCGRDTKAKETFLPDCIDVW